MSEKTNNTENTNPVDLSAELYQQEKTAMMIANEYAEQFEFNGDEPSSKELGKMSRAEEAREQTIEASNEHAQRHIDEIHEAAIAEAAERVADVYKDQDKP